VTNPPFRFSWSNYVLGDHRLSAVVTDNPGVRATSAVVTVSAHIGTPVTLVPSGATWRYLDVGAEPPAGWKHLLSFNDSAWKSGPTRLGYGGDGESLPAVSYGSDSANKYTTTYFRRAFTVLDAPTIQALTASLLRDDGGIVYLNGTEIFRSGMPTGSVSYSTFAALTVSGAEEQTFYETNVNPALLVTGTNLLAVEIHQVTRDSSDMGFNFKLSGEGVTVPQPLLAARYQQLSHGLTLSWQSVVPDFNVLAAGDLAPGSGWTKITNAVSRSNDQYSVTLPVVGSGPRFFRLHRD
jgi:hypothetical protein